MPIVWGDVMKIYDICVVGGGIIGAEIARNLTDKQLSVCLCEATADIAQGGATKANSGIVHAGFDCHVGTLKAKMNVLGSEMYPALCERLGVPLNNCGALVVGREQDLPVLQKLYDQGVQNGVKELSVIGREEILKHAKTLNEEIKYALYAKTSSVVSPYLMAIACAEEAKINGCDFYFESVVTKIKKEGEIFHITAGENQICAKVVINASGAGSLEVNKIAGAEEFPLRFARGEYMLLDLTEKGFVDLTMFPLPTEKGKGVLVSPTEHGNIILGPTAIDCEADEVVVSQEGLDYIKGSVDSMVKGANLRKNIRVFAGNRVISGDDFTIKASEKVENFIYLAGICSPGLSSAPAIGDYVAEIVEKLGFKLVKNKDFKKRTPYYQTLKMSEKQLDELIKSDGSFGKIVCRCEKITEGEILQAINSPLKPKTVDGVKRRVRAGMGRCQGGFCMPRVMELIASENNMEIQQVTKFGGNSNILIK